MFNLRFNLYYNFYTNDETRGQGQQQQQQQQGALSDQDFLAFFYNELTVRRLWIVGGVCRLTRQAFVVRVPNRKIDVIDYLVDSRIS